MDPNRLTAIPFFSHLSPEETKRLAAFATEASVAKGQLLIKEGDYSTELIAIEEGTADVARGGRKIASVKEGDLIGERGLMTHEHRSADVIAVSGAGDQADPVGAQADVGGDARWDQGDHRAAPQSGLRGPGQLRLVRGRRRSPSARRHATSRVFW